MSPPAAAWIVLAIAALWSVGLLVAAVTVPVYNTGETLTEVNGAGALGAVAITLVVTAAVALAIWRRRWAGRLGAGPSAWTLCVLLLLFCLISGFSIGLFVLPVAIALVVGCALAS